MLEVESRESSLGQREAFENPLTQTAAVVQIKQQKYIQKYKEVKISSGCDLDLATEHARQLLFLSSLLFLKQNRPEEIGETLQKVDIISQKKGRSLYNPERFVYANFKQDSLRQALAHVLSTHDDTRYYTEEWVGTVLDAAITGNPVPDYYI